MELARWYAEVLGLRPACGDEHWQEFETSSGSRFAIDVPAFPRSVVEKQPVIVSFRVDDIEAAVEALAGKGVVFFPSREKAVFDVGPALVATFQDLDGNWVQLSQPKQK
jgi:catechol 2,3-dioxygenase-like lactoylglutathione lyase family enzyme